jgi:hypothetical protein
MNFEVTDTILLFVFTFAFLLGGIAQRTNFCTMGAVSDWVNMGNTARLGAWYLSIAVAIIGVLILERFLSVPLDSTIPPYRTANFAWLRYLLGGFMFGIGMTLAGGCGSKTLINIGMGSLRSVVVLVVAGVMAFLMTKTSFYEVVFHSWINATTINLSSWGIQSQSLVDISAALLGIESATALQVVISLLLAGIFLFYALASKHLRKNKRLIFAGVSIGLIIIAGWYISGGSLGQEAIENAEWMEQRPVGVGVQSYTFINPMGELLYYMASPTNTLLISFGMLALLGVILGSFVSALQSGHFSPGVFSSKVDIIKHIIGGILMGTGGVLAMGCTIGQGITGVSTLSVGSILALFAIISGSAITLKISYYKMMYDDEATFIASFFSSLVDFKMLPESMRRLEG